MNHNDPKTTDANGGAVRLYGPPGPSLAPTDIHQEVNNVIDGQGTQGEYLVDVETHQSFLVRATTPEEAIAKAVLQNADPDEAVTEIGRDVHVCVHGGNDHEEFEGDEGEE